MMDTIRSSFLKSAACFSVLCALGTGLSVGNLAAHVGNEFSSSGESYSELGGSYTGQNIDTDPVKIRDFDAGNKGGPGEFDNASSEYGAAPLPYDWSVWDYLFGPGFSSDKRDGEDKWQKYQVSENDGYEYEMNSEEPVSEEALNSEEPVSEEALNSEEPVSEEAYSPDFDNYGEVVDDDEEGSTQFDTSNYETPAEDIREGVEEPVVSEYASESGDTESVTIEDVKKEHENLLSIINRFLPRSATTALKQGSTGDDFASSIKAIEDCAEKAAGDEHLLRDTRVFRWDDVALDIQSCIKSCRFVIENAHYAGLLNNNQPEEVKRAYNKMCPVLDNLAIQCTAQCIIESDYEGGPQLNVLSDELGAEINGLQQQNKELASTLRPALMKYMKKTGARSSIIPSIQRLSKICGTRSVDYGSSNDEIVEAILQLRRNDSGYKSYLSKNPSYKKVDFLSSEFEGKYDISLRSGSEQLLKLFSHDTALRSALNKLLTNNCKIAWATDMKGHMDTLVKQILKYQLEKLDESIKELQEVDAKALEETREGLEDFINSRKNRDQFIQKSNELAEFFDLGKLSEDSSIDEIIDFMLSLRGQDTCYMRGLNVDSRMASFRDLAKEKYDNEDIKKATKDLIALFRRRVAGHELKRAIEGNSELEWKLKLRDEINKLL